MTIDPDTGLVRIGLHVIEPTLSPQAFLASPLGRNSKELVRNGPWVTYSTEVAEEVVNVGLSIVFQDSKLHEVRFTIGSPSESRSNWSQSSIRDEGARAKAVLEASLGAVPCKLSWGEAISECDPRSGSGYGLIRFL